MVKPKRVSLFGGSGGSGEQQQGGNNNSAPRRGNSSSRTPSPPPPNSALGDSELVAEQDEGGSSNGEQGMRGRQQGKTSYVSGDDDEEAAVAASSGDEGEAPTKGSSKKKGFRNIRSSISHGVKGGLGLGGRQQNRDHSASGAGGGASVKTFERPSYRLYDGKQSPEHSLIEEDDDEDDDDESGTFHQVKSESVVKARHIESSAGTHRLQRILNKQQHELMMQQHQEAVVAAGGAGINSAAGTAAAGGGKVGGGGAGDPTTDPNSLLLAGMHRPRHFEKLSDPKDTRQVARLVERVVLPSLAVDLNSIGGQKLLSKDKDAASSSKSGYYPDEIMQQECLCILPCKSFESTGQETVTMSALQYPKDYTKHKRSLGLLHTAANVGMHTSHHHGGGRAQKLRYICLARSTTRPLLQPAIKPRPKQKQKVVEEIKAKVDRDDSEQGDYDTMFHASSSFVGDDSERDESMTSGDNLGNLTNPLETPDSKAPTNPTDIYHKAGADRDNDDDEEADGASGEQAEAGGEDDEEEKRDENSDAKVEDEIASFPVLVCLALNHDGTAPDIRKLVPIHKLTTVQNLHATVCQLAFDNGDTIRLDFATTDDKVAEASLDKERFIWSLIQVHAMLCISVVERNSMTSTSSTTAATSDKPRMMLPPLNVRNLDRAELQYVATVNNFLKKSKIMCALLDRQERYYLDEKEELMQQQDQQQQRPETREKIETERRNNMAYDLMMGNVNMRLSLFTSEEERKDAEEILNSTEWTRLLTKEDSSAAINVAERLGLMLQMRMRDLEAETCRRLIAWEDEKHFSVTGQQKLFTSEDERDTVDALALASLFKTLEALDSELQGMEFWLQERAAAIKPLTDDCADIEEENRQLEQQWKSYDMLGSEMRRLLRGMDLESDIENILQNPASALIYDDDTGRVDVDASDEGVEQIYQSGKSLQDAIDFPRKSGGLHLDAVSERADKLQTVATSFCTALAHIIVTVMEQFNQEVLAGSDYGKVSKNDTHAMIAKKVRDTQRKFQSALLGYIKLIEILASLSPEMLPALRDAYSEMVAESILMKKRMKGYFQALPGKNAAYMNKAGKDLKDYVAFDDEVLEMVNAPDMKAALTELLPVVAREAYFTSALFGASTKEQDGREKKRNFERTRKAVDNASQHFRYYIERTCGILPDQIAGRSTVDHGVKGDPLLCLVGSIYLNEAMNSYIDRERKGGDHSLSLAYVRATILDLRKKADKQWVGWIDKQIEWIKSNGGVPLSGKRAGIFASFARFPSYLDHVLLACSEGRDEDYVPDIVNIKVINYYLQKLAATLLESLKECAERDTTDQTYAANVMQMENTYFFTNSIKHRNAIFAELFAKQVTKANSICKDATDSYLGYMIKREFSSLHELFSKISKLRKEMGDSQVPQQVPKAQFVRTMQKEVNKDVLKEKIGVMFNRMEKHLSEEGGLLPVAWKALVKVLYEWFGRWEKLCTQIYTYVLKPSAVDIVRIAKAAGGASKPKQSLSNEFGFKSILALGQNANANANSTANDKEQQQQNTGASNNTSTT